MTWLLYSIAFVVAVFVLILVHETGHFLMARLFKVKVERFSIGFGKPFYIWQNKRKGTEYAFAPFLIGGYVKLLDSRETKIDPRYKSHAFDHQGALARISIIAAGPTANILFAFLAFWLMFVIGFKSPKPIIGEILPASIANKAHMVSDEEITKIGKRQTSNWTDVIVGLLDYYGDNEFLALNTEKKGVPKKYNLQIADWRLDPYNPDPLLDLGLVRYKPLVLPIIHKIAPGSPAERSGLASGDLIIKVGNKKVYAWEDFMRFIKSNPNKNIAILIKRNGKYLTLDVVTGWRFSKGLVKEGFLGVELDKSKIGWPEDKVKQFKYGFLTALPQAIDQMKIFFDLNAIILNKLISGKMSLSIIGGPIATFSASGQAFSQGFVMFLGFLAMISLTIAIVNLLPLPGLDGGFIVLTFIEVIIGHPISRKIQALIIRLGIALFVLLVLQTTANDLMRMFG